MNYFVRVKDKITKLIQPKPEKKCLHFLHIGKTGGTAIVYALNQHGYCVQSPQRTRANLPDIYSLNQHAENTQLVIYIHAHNEPLQSIPEGEKVFFFLRDPISRFTSGFYSRQRQGKPRYNSPWSEAEKMAYEHFETINQLGLALSSKDSGEKERAKKAMRNIQHVRDSYWKWFENEAYFRSRQADILFIGFQENLTQDFERLKAKLKLPDNVTLPSDTVLAHKNPPDVDKKLDPIALHNLKEWYKEDYRFIELAKNFWPTF
jgi:hypothetical protein